MLGPPGSGKSTQAQRAAAKYGIPHLSAGVLLRAAVASDAPVERSLRMPWRVTCGGGSWGREVIIQTMRNFQCSNAIELYDTAGSQDA